MTTLNQKFQNYNLERKHQEFILLMVKEWLLEKRQDQYQKQLMASNWRLARINMLDELLEELK